MPIQPGDCVQIPDGRIAQRPFGGAGFPRTAYAADRTGHHLLHTMWQQCLKRKLTFYSEWYFSRLITHEGRAIGAHDRAIMRAMPGDPRPCGAHDRARSPRCLA